MAAPFSVIVVLEATSGGAKRHVIDLAAGLVQAGVRVGLACAHRRADGVFAAECAHLRQLGVEVRHLDMARSLIAPVNIRTAWQVWRWWTAWSNDGACIVHGHSSIGGACARLAAIFADIDGRRIPCVYTPHSPITMAPAVSPGIRRLYAWCERVQSWWTSRIIAVGHQEQVHVQRILGPAAVVSEIPNGVRIPQISEGVSPANERSPQSESVGTWNVLWVGRFNAQKRLDRAVHLIAATPQLQVTVVGDGPQRADLASECQAQAVSERLTFAGHIADVAPYYQAAQALLITSDYEGLPYVILEAMAHGLPIVGFAAPGVTDILSRTGNCIIDPQLSMSEAGAQIIDWLAKSPDQGRINRQHIERDYTIDVMVRRTLHEYSASISSRGLARD